VVTTIGDVAGLRATIRGLTPRPARRIAVLIQMRHHVVRRPRESLNYVLRGRETINFTYPISNRDELVDFVAGLTGDPRAAGYFSELEQDSELAGWLREGLATRKDREKEPYFGRRVVWYALVRLRKPRLVVETGVHDGLGSAVILRALERNGKGRLLGMDISPTSGWLIPLQLRDRFDFQLGPSLASIETLVQPVDIFLHDSDHRYAYETAEYVAVAPKLTKAGTLISDNAHACDALKDYATRSQRRFGFCRELSAHHWYPGAGVGVAVPD